MTKTIHRIEYTKKNRTTKKWWQRWKSILQTNSSAVYGKAMENMRNRVDARLVNNKKGYLK